MSIDRLDPLASFGGKGDDRMNLLIIEQIANEQELDLPVSDSSLRNYRHQLKDAGYVTHTANGGRFSQYGRITAQAYLNGFAMLLGEAIGDESRARDLVGEMTPLSLTGEMKECDGTPEEALELYNMYTDSNIESESHVTQFEDNRDAAGRFLDEHDMFYTGSPLGSEPDWPEWPFSDAMLDELDDRHSLALNAGYRLYTVRR